MKKSISIRYKLVWLYNFSSKLYISDLKRLKLTKLKIVYKNIIWFKLPFYLFGLQSLFFCSFFFFIVFFFNDGKPIIKILFFFSGDQQYKIYSARIRHLRASTTAAAASHILSTFTMHFYCTIANVQLYSFFFWLYDIQIDTKYCVK